MVAQLDRKTNSLASGNPEGCTNASRDIDALASTGALLFSYCVGRYSGDFCLD